ncbi:MAG: hypothetical protein H6737_12080 [Alphaproteobacteria bacterium]|nr:hypothetical protein [Alphaproteobacteria bacterium]
MRYLVPLLMLAACERTVSSDADCEAWVDACNACAQQCTPRWDVPAETCDLGCPDDPLPACVADGGSCTFSD